MTNTSAWPAWTLRFALPFVVLNALLTMENHGPGLWPRPALRLSFELAMALLALTAWIAWRGRAGERTLRLLAAVSSAWIVVRYLDVTVSAVFGRQINLYWDGRHALEVVRMGDLAGWQLALGAMALLAVPWLLYRLTLVCWRRIAQALASPPRRPAIRPAIGLAGLLLAASFAAHGIGGRDTRWFFSMPVAPILAHQAEVLAGQLMPGRAEAQLSPSPEFANVGLAGLHNADVLLLFAESYGVTTLDNPRQAEALAPARARFAQALAAGGLQVVSARVRSPTFGGASWLAHAALLSGVDTHDPGAYELLLATDRPTLVRHFQTHGWRTVSWMPGLHRPWPEGSFYGFDRYVDADRTGYRGAAFGYWRVPDQASMALLHAQELAQPPGTRAPRFIVFPTLASHAPFRPLPPYLADWDRLLGPDAYSPDELATAQAKPAGWQEVVPAYLESLGYTFDWLGDYLGRRAPRTLLTIVIGDHQPLAGVSGTGASWDVPVHVISADAALLGRFEAHGFARGLMPPPGQAQAQAPTLDMHALTPLLAQLLDAPPPAPAGTAE
ncbi:sulfatase-like hydrolase/transferase [Variovorax sp. KK3]|uniref:sulfatase-like hydrolase/transferase n=1 Tax=Variovorax sp. KK3 TaxID=1855728 RepID=UPI00097C5C7D|nr:sulfatase-like hydrolase/transferase [Variovorax sp. KK3]